MIIYNVVMSDQKSGYLDCVSFSDKEDATKFYERLKSNSESFNGLRLDIQNSELCEVLMTFEDKRGYRAALRKFWLESIDEQIVTEYVEPCPYCGAENIYKNWDTETQGYVAKCEACGKEIFLCDACLHSDDNPGQKCDWHECDQIFTGKCFRGVTFND